MNPSTSAAPLARRHCRPCEGGIPPLTPAAANKYLTHLQPQWGIAGKFLERDFSFPGFAAAVKFVNRVAAIAEIQNHHPDICLHNYRRVKISLTTHAINGLNPNDFIVAAKIDRITKNSKPKRKSEN